jgi:hypothetical protein
MDTRPAYFPVAAVRKLFHTAGQPRWWAIAVVLGVALAQSVAVFAGSYLDGTLILPSVGDGFLEHYGVWAILVTDPLLIVAAGLAYRRFIIAFDTLPLVSAKKTKTAFPALLGEHVDFLNMVERSKYVYFLLVATGVLCWLNNLRQTVEPIEIYGNDVFDSYQYQWGYLANKFNLFSSWVLVYPLVGFLLVCMSVSTRQMLRQLASANDLTPNVLHPDGCYGMLNLGILNLSLLLPYLLSYSVIFALFSTHETQYFSIVSALVGLTVVMVVASFLTIGPITGLGKAVRKETFEKLKDKSETYNGNRRVIENRFAFERLCFVTARASPYSKWAQTAVNLVRIVPVFLTAYRLFS